MSGIIAEPSFGIHQPRDADDWAVCESGLIIPSHLAIEREHARRRTLAVDLFAGCGGFSCGAMQAGMNVTAMVEWDATAVMTYCANLCRWGAMEFHFLSKADEKRMEKAIQLSWKRANKKGRDQLEFCFAGQGWISGQPNVEGCRHVIVGDIRLLKGEDLMKWIGVERGELGAILGSPPCQGFSTANSHRHSGDPRNDLCFEFARLVVECLPHTICLENVPDFGTSPQFARFVQILKQGGFEGVEALEALASKRKVVTGTAVRTKTRKKKGAEE